MMSGALQSWNDTPARQAIVEFVERTIREGGPDVSRLWKVAEFRRYRRERPVEFWLGVATLTGVITIDVLPGLVIGVGSMLLLVIWHASRPHLSVLGSIPGTPGAYGDVNRYPDYQSTPGLLVLRLEAPLFCANATPVRDRIKQLVGATTPPPQSVILDIGANERLDITSVEMLAQLLATLRSAGIDLAIADARQPVIQMARRSGLLDQLGQARVFHTVDEAVQNTQRDEDHPVGQPSH